MTPKLCFYRNWSLSTWHERFSVIYLDDDAKVAVGEYNVQYIPYAPSNSIRIKGKRKVHNDWTLKAYPVHLHLSFVSNSGIRMEKGLGLFIGHQLYNRHDVTPRDFYGCPCDPDFCGRYSRFGLVTTSRLTFRNDSFTRKIYLLQSPKKNPETTFLLVRKTKEKWEKNNLFFIGS